MNTIEIVIKRLQAEVDDVRRARLALFETPTERAERLSRERDLRSLVDDVCRHWILARSWPLLEPELARFAWDRVLRAHMVASTLQQEDAKRLAAFTPEELLERLLMHGAIVDSQSQGGGSSATPDRMQRER